MFIEKLKKEMSSFIIYDNQNDLRISACWAQGNPCSELRSYGGVNASGILSTSCVQHPEVSTHQEGLQEGTATLDGLAEYLC